MDDRHRGNYIGVDVFLSASRKLVGVIALFLHAGILFWNCQTWDCNLLLWNISLMFAGLVLISPWREWPWTSWIQSNWPARAASIALLVCPAGYYMNWTAAYLSHCVYVPNTPYAELFRPAESPQFVPFLCYNEVHFPLPPSQEISEQWFSKIRRPGDVLVIHDPRPWARIARHERPGSSPILAKSTPANTLLFATLMAQNSKKGKPLTIASKGFGCAGIPMAKSRSGDC